MLPMGFELLEFGLSIEMYFTVQISYPVTLQHVNNLPKTLRFVTDQSANEGQNVANQAEVENVPTITDEQYPESNAKVVKFHEISPRAKLRATSRPITASGSKTRGRPSRGAQKEQDLTCSPYKRLLEEKKNLEKAKRQAKSRKTSQSCSRNDSRPISELHLNIVKHVIGMTVGLHQNFLWTLLKMFLWRLQWKIGFAFCVMNPLLKIWLSVVIV
ncbi:hypothetical protein PR048_007402 [Dryococelus australis]|uniref:Uncharacterized protein n=1 Tax=Dryococelus australis TaxID=614101 RepID=A0ABQ9HVT1_9NEOP|nr:hypothetical protein PR048_007402 [Dryococelus australis]